MTVVDIRPDRYLREVREHGDMGEAARKAGLTADELNELLQLPKYYRAIIECVRERREEQLIIARDEAIAQIRTDYNTRITELNARAETLLRGLNASSG